MQDKEYQQAKKAVDVKTLIKMQKQISVLKKSMFSKKGLLFVKAIVRNPNDYENLCRYIKKKQNQIS